MLAEHKAPVYDTGGLSLVTSSIRRSPPDCLDPKIHHANLLPSILGAEGVLGDFGGKLVVSVCILGLTTPSPGATIAGGWECGCTS